MRTLAIALLAAVALAGCLQHEPAPHYTCEASATQLHWCIQYGALDAYGTGYLGWYCSSSGGTWGTDLACPTANRVASCSWPNAGGETHQTYYAGVSAQDLAGYEGFCAQHGGTWTTYP